MAINLSQFKDIEYILDQVLNQEQQRGEFRLPEYSDAARWRMRANRFRVALRKVDARNRGVDEGEGTCLYDALVFSLPRHSRTVFISPVTDIKGELTLGTGKHRTAKVNTVPTGEDHELENFLQSFDPNATDDTAG